MNVVRARTGLDSLELRFPFADLDGAVDLASWLASRGYTVDIVDDNPFAIVQPPVEAEECKRLVELFARSLDTPPRAW